MDILRRLSTVDLLRPIHLFAWTHQGKIENMARYPLTSREVREAWREYIARTTDPAIDMYLHIPFCSTECAYCFHYKELFDVAKMGRYVDYVRAYLAAYRDVFAGVTLRSLYIGGGTPSLLSCEQMTDIVGYISEHFRFVDGAERTCEVNPTYITRAKVRTLKRLGINRISLGVQSLDAEVLRTARRAYQSRETVRSCIDLLRSEGITHINVDMIVGLAGDTSETFAETFTTLVSFGTSSITFYHLERTDSYVRDVYAGDAARCDADIETRIAEAHAYLSEYARTHRDHDYFLDRHNGYRSWRVTLRPQTTTTTYGNFGNGALLGIGPTARSYIGGALVYQGLRSVPESYASEGIYEYALRVTRDDEMGLYTLRRIRSRGRVDGAEFRQLFGA